MLLLYACLFSVVEVLVTCMMLCHAGYSALAELVVIHSSFRAGREDASALNSSITHRHAAAYRGEWLTQCISHSVLHARDL
jgi:hypothetical protein